MRHSWHPAPEPSSLELVAGALWENVQDPAMAVENLRGALTSALGVAVAVGEAVGGVGGAFGELAADALGGRRPASDSPLDRAGVGAAPLRHGCRVPRPISRQSVRSIATRSTMWYWP